MTPCFWTGGFWNLRDGVSFILDGETAFGQYYCVSKRRWRCVASQKTWILNNAAERTQNIAQLIDRLFRFRCGAAGPISATFKDRSEFWGVISAGPQVDTNCPGGKSATSVGRARSWVITANYLGLTQSHCWIFAGRWLTHWSLPQHLYIPLYLLLFLF